MVTCFGMLRRATHWFLSRSGSGRGPCAETEAETSVLHWPAVRAIDAPKASFGNLRLEPLVRAGPTATHSGPALDRARLRRCTCRPRHLDRFLVAVRTPLEHVAEQALQAQ